MRMLALWMVGIAVTGLLVAPLMAGDQAAAGADRPKLTEEQKTAVKALVQKLHQDMQPLREAVRAEVQKLRELWKSRAGQEAIQDQIAVVKEKVAAVKARFEQFKTDLKAAVPPEVYQKIIKRLHEKMQEFLENHPALRERIENRREHRRPRGAAAE